MTLTVTHATVTGTPADNTALVDGPAWDAAHTITGNLPVSNLNSGTNASFHSFWRGDGTWAEMPYVTLEMFGGGTSSTDNTAALNAAVAYLYFADIRTIRLRGGSYTFATKPAAFTTTVIIIGESFSETSLIRNYSAGGANEGFITWAGSVANGSRLQDVQIFAADGTTSGCLLAITTGAADPAGFQSLENVVFTHTGTGDYTQCLYLDGTANQTSGSQGLRDLSVQNCYFFHGATSTESLRLLNATNHSIFGWANGSCVISGGGTTLTNTTVGVFDMTVLGEVFVSNSLAVTLYGNYNSLILSTGSSLCSNFASYRVGNFSDSGTGNVNGGNVFVGATSGAAGYSGVVTAPVAGQQNSLLSGNGGWSSYYITGTTGKTFNFSNTLSFAGTDGTTMTFPSTSGAVNTSDSTATLTNKTFDTAGTGNVLKVNNAQISTYTGLGSTIALSNTPSFTTPILGTPISVTLTNGTGLPVSTGLTGAGTGILTALGVNVGTAGAPVVNGGVLGTPSSGVATNLTGTASGLTAGNVTTNANLTGDVTSVGNATTLTNAPVIAKVLTGYVSGAGTVAATDTILQAIQKLNGNDATNANLTGVITSVGNATSIASQTGTGTKFVVDTSPTLVAPTLGAATATSLAFSPTTGGIIGTTTNDSAGSGKVGEYIESVIAVGSAVSLANGTTSNITSISLTAGDWDVELVPCFTGGTTTLVTYLCGSISNSSASYDSTNGRFTSQLVSASGTALFNNIPNAVNSLAGVTVRFSLSGTTTIYGAALAGFSVSTCSAFGVLRARRVR